MDFIKQGDTDLNLMVKSKEQKKAIFLPLNDLILDKFKGFVIDKKPMPNLKYSDVWKVTKVMAPDLKTTKYDRIGKILLLIPFLPVLLIVLLITKLFKNTDWIGRLFTLQFARLFMFLRRRKPEYWTKKERRIKYPDADEEDIPAFFAMCKERNVKVVLYSYNPLTNEQNKKLEKLISGDDVYSCQIITAFPDLATYIQQENISILNSKLVISNILERDETEKLGFISGYNYAKNRNVHLWGNHLIGTQDNLLTNSRSTLNVFKHHIIPL
jgi:hypothetical protein